MKKAVLENGELIFKEIDPVLPRKFGTCGGCGKVVKTESLKTISSKGWSKKLCKNCLRGIEVK